MTQDRPNVVLLHGVGYDRHMWQAQIESLEAAGARVIAYDLLCHGETPKPDHPVALSHFVDQLSDVLTREGLPRAMICGFSFGGMIAQSFAATYPERVEKLVIMGAVYRRSPEQLVKIRQRLETAETQGTHSMVPDALERWLTPRFRQENPGEVEKIRTRLQNNKPRDFLAAYRTFVHSDDQVAGRLKRITAPALVIAGEDDPGSTPEMAERMVAELPEARLHIVRGGRHMLPLEWAGEINQQLKQFFLENEERHD